ncbi:MAG: tetratricopeptide repeat protein [Leptospirales bacterium]
MIEAAKLNQEGLSYFQRGNYRVALEKFMGAAAKDAQNAEYANNAGMCHYQLTQFANARKLFEKAIKLKPELPLYHFNAGLVAMHQQRLKDAEKHFSKVVALDDDNAAAWSHLGLLSYNRKKFAAASSSWEKAAALKRDAELENNLGMAYLEQNRVGEAEERFKKSVAINARFALAHYNLGVLYQNKKQDYRKAAEHYEQAVRSQPQNYAAYMNLGIVYTRLGDNARAIQNLEEFLRFAPPQLSRQVADAKKRLRELRAN